MAVLCIWHCLFVCLFVGVSVGLFVGGVCLFVCLFVLMGCLFLRFVYPPRFDVYMLLICIVLLFLIIYFIVL